MRFRKQGGIGNKALGLGPSAIEAELVNLCHSETSHTGSNILMGLAPGLKRSSIEVWISGSLVPEESVQQLEGAGRVVEKSAEGPLQTNVSREDGGQLR
jgi:hypothetical protein